MLSTTTQPLCPNIHSAFQFSVAHKYTTSHLLGAQVPYILVFLSPKLGVVPVEEPLSILITKFIATQHDMSSSSHTLLATLGMTASIANGAAGQINSLNIYHRLSSPFSLSKTLLLC